MQKVVLELRASRGAEWGAECRASRDAELGELGAEFTFENNCIMCYNKFTFFYVCVANT